MELQNEWVGTGRARIGAAIPSNCSTKEAPLSESLKSGPWLPEDPSWLQGAGGLWVLERTTAGARGIMKKRLSTPSPTPKPGDFKGQHFVRWSLSHIHCFVFCGCVLSHRMVSHPISTTESPPGDDT